ncbi:hypothetical protein ATO5_02150 [Loktanella sp. 22II-4b]|nr:hypothetical protein ATO5_02150 [Loktanella sp. 22II-4b]
MLRSFAAGAPLPVMSKVALRMAVMAMTWSTRARTRAALANLSDEALRDVGLTREEMRAEANRPFWQG